VENLNILAPAGADHQDEASSHQMKRDDEVGIDEEAEIDFVRNRYVSISPFLLLRF
jgi:hypothetical protein